MSWFREHARLSVQLIQQVGVSREAGIIDVGGGAWTLIDDLRNEGYTKVAVLDLSEAALAASQSRMGQRADEMSLGWLATSHMWIFRGTPMTCCITERSFIS